MRLLPDQRRPAHPLLIWFPAAGLPLLPPPKLDEGKDGPRQARRCPGDRGTQPHRGQRLQTSEQWPDRRGGLDRHDSR